ncbi:MAG: response regulator [Calditrichaeota bacterium]|nr:MAG: response regulator [Calditrichota bacterium]
MKKDFKILIVDDDAIVRNKFSSILIGKGYKVITAADGYAALSAAITAQPDLIFLDLIMPNMDGFKTLQEIRKMSRTEKIPIVIVTARTDAMTLVKALKLGANDFISKPFLEAEVIRKIEHLLAHPESPQNIQESPLFEHTPHMVSGKNYQQMKEDFILDFEKSYLMMIKLLADHNYEELKIAITRLLDIIQFYQIRGVKDKILQMLMAITSQNWDKAMDLMEQTYHTFQTLRRAITTSSL